MAENVTPAAAFELLAAEPRMDVMQALVEARREGETPLSFSALRGRTGIDDSGRFNYHLGKLVGTFVEKTDEGYDLSYAGSTVVAAVIAGTYTGTERKGPVPLDEDCGLCGAELAARYDDGELDVRCADDHELFFARFPPGAAADMDMATLLEVATLRIYHRLELMSAGRCSECFGPVESTAGTRDFADREMHVIDTECERCGGGTYATAGAYLLFEPEVIAFHREHGRDIYHERPWRLVQWEQDAASLRSTDPYRLQFDFEMDDDRLRVLLDDAGRVVETSRPE